VRYRYLKQVMLFCILGIIEVFGQGFFGMRSIGMMNRGMAFGFGFWGLEAVVAFLWLVLSVYLMRKQTRFSGWWLIWTGGGANLLSRVLFGGIWDYLSIIPGFWFNGADIMIILGAGERIYSYMKGQKK
jgi:lipoprotein signal peptidase